MEMPYNAPVSSSPTGSASKRCLNCILQKTSCDKTLPVCLKCVKKGRKCLGYSVRLSWPRDNDERRAVRSRGHYLVPTQSGQVRFVNTTADDVQEAPNQGCVRRYDRQILAPFWLSSPAKPLLEINLDASIAAGRYVQVAHLLSSSQEASSLYGLLVRLSAADSSLPSLATRYALSALTYQSMARTDGAAAHQGAAIRALQGAIESPGDGASVMRMMAASMLLSTLESINYDSSDLSWSIFFCGTKRIAGLVTQQHHDYAGDEALIIDWIFYHDVMYKFSIKHWQNKNDDQIQLAAQEKVVSKAIFSPERQTVVPIAGCSLELLDILCQVIDAVHERQSPEYLSETHSKVLRGLKTRLQSLTQHHSGVSTELDILGEEHQHAEQIAELYRLAALVYLSVIAKGDSVTCSEVSGVLERAFGILRVVCQCERPWPLFILGLAAREEEQRLIILRVLEEALAIRPQGTMALTNRMIRDAWIQQDLAENGELDLPDLYGQVISRNRVPPCFV